jgi:hypothetical protein
VDTYSTMSKVPAVTLGFWIIKIAATTLGETGGDTVTMTLNWGYLAGTSPIAALRSVRNRNILHLGGRPTQSRVSSETATTAPLRLCR